MKQRFILLITLFIIFSCKSKKQEKDVNIIKTKEQVILAYPDLFIENKIVDFSSVPQDTILKANYKLTNPSENDLIIEYINPDCTCTDYTISSDTIKPKKSATLILVLNTKDKIGKQKIDAIIKTNSKTKFYKIVLKAYVK